MAHGAFYLCTPWGDKLPSSLVCSSLHGASGQTGREGTNGSLGILAKCYVTYKTCPPRTPSCSPEPGGGVQPRLRLCCLAAGCSEEDRGRRGCAHPAELPAVPAAAHSTAARGARLGCTQGGTCFPKTSEHVKPLPSV